MSFGFRRGFGNIGFYKIERNKIGYYFYLLVVNIDFFYIYVKFEKWKKCE